MSRFLRSILPLALSFILLASAAWGEAKGIFYIVRSGDSIAYLLGSVHLGKKDFYPLPQHVEKAFSDAGALVLEVDPGKMDAPAARQEMMSRALYAQGDGLRNHVPPPVYDAVLEKGAVIGLPPQVLERMKPWMVAFTLQILSMQKDGLSPEDGVEKYFLRKGEGKKRLEELESVDFQVRLLSGFSESEEVLFLQDTLSNASNASIIEAMISAWRAGDAGALERVLSDPLRAEPRLLPVYERVLFSRNLPMAARIEKLMKEKVRPFVVVGAAHLVGPKGVAAILRGKGYTVEQQ